MVYQLRRFYHSSRHRRYNFRRIYRVNQPNRYTFNRNINRLSRRRIYLGYRLPQRRFKARQRNRHDYASDCLLKLTSRRRNFFAHLFLFQTLTRQVSAGFQRQPYRQRKWAWLTTVRLFFPAMENFLHLRQPYKPNLQNYRRTYLHFLDDHGLPLPPGITKRDVERPRPIFKPLSLTFEFNRYQQTATWLAVFRELRLWLRSKRKLSFKAQILFNNSRSHNGQRRSKPRRK